MAAFVPGVDTGVMSDGPHLEVLASATRPLPVGRHAFQLVVTDNAGNASAPVVFYVTVRSSSKPTAEIDLIREDGTRQYEPRAVVAYGKPFTLTGERSSDANGVVKTWRWTLLAP